MRYYEFDTFGGPEVLRFVEGPDLVPDDDGVVIEVRAAGVNYADIMARAGVYPPVQSPPFRPGFEVAGVISAVGKSVSDVAVGDRVAAVLFTAAGYATQAATKASQIIQLPAHVEFGVAAGLLAQGMTAFFLIEHAGLEADENVLITGAAGGVGSMAVQIAKIKGARVLGLASTSKHAAAIGFGADAVFDYTKPGWSLDINDHLGSKKINVFLDAVGDFATEAFDTLAHSARWIPYGVMSEGKPLQVDRTWPLIFGNISIRGYTIDTDVTEFPRAMKDLIGWVQDGSLRVEVTEFPLADAAKAHAAISNRETTGKVVLVP